VIDPKDIIDALILQGALSIEGIDEKTGQMIFSVTDKMKEIAPEIYDEFAEALHKTVLSLWEKGFINMNITEPEPVVSPTEFALDRSTWKGLSHEEISIMNTLMMRFEGEI
jgi:hypothetical protein